jgi:hypothetical protein
MKTGKAFPIRKRPFLFSGSTGTYSVIVTSLVTEPFFAVTTI